MQKPIERAAQNSFGSYHLTHLTFLFAEQQSKHFSFFSLNQYSECSSAPVCGKTIPFQYFVDLGIAFARFGSDDFFCHLTLVFLLNYSSFILTPHSFLTFALDPILGLQSNQPRSRLQGDECIVTSNNNHNNSCFVGLCVVS